MYIEGTVGKEYLSYLQKAGWEIDYVIENIEQAKEKGVELDPVTFEGGCVWVRIWIDTGIEEYIAPADICEVLESDQKWDILKEMARSSDSGISEPAQDVLRDKHKSF